MWTKYIIINAYCTKWPLGKNTLLNNASSWDEAMY